jgi:hypothetical protein
LIAVPKKLVVSIGAVFVSLSFDAIALAQSYSHEYVLPDGGSIDCSTRYYGSSRGSTECTRLSPKARTKGLKLYSDALGRINDCSDVAAEGGSEDYLSWAFKTCLGTFDVPPPQPFKGDMKTYLINCDGSLSKKQVFGSWHRPANDCPGLKELVMKGELIVPVRRCGGKLIEKTEECVR